MKVLISPLYILCVILILPPWMREGRGDGALCNIMYRNAFDNLSNFPSLPSHTQTHRHRHTYFIWLDNFCHFEQEKLGKGMLEFE